MSSTPRVLTLAVAALSLAACESSFPQDLVTFCRVVGEVDATAGMSAKEKLLRIEARRGEYANYALFDTRDIWKEAADQTGEDRYRYLVAAAKKMKAPDWRCPAYGTLLNMAAVVDVKATAPVEATTPEVAPSEAVKLAADAAPTGDAVAGAAAGAAGAAAVGAAAGSVVTADKDPAPAAKKKKATAKSRRAAAKKTRLTRRGA